MVDLGWLNGNQARIAPSMCSEFGVFILRQFFLSMPVEIDDAARIDVAGSWQISPDCSCLRAPVAEGQPGES